VNLPFTVLVTINVHLFLFLHLFVHGITHKSDANLAIVTVNMSG